MEQEEGEEHTMPLWMNNLPPESRRRGGHASPRQCVFGRHKVRQSLPACRMHLQQYSLTATTDPLKTETVSSSRRQFPRTHRGSRSSGGIPDMQAANSPLMAHAHAYRGNQKKWLAHPHDGWLRGGRLGEPDFHVRILGVPSKFAH